MALSSRSVLILVLAAVLVFSSGCTAPASPEKTPAVTPAPTPVSAQPSVQTSPVPIPATTRPVVVATTAPAAAPAPAATWIPRSSEAASVDNPHTVFLDFTKSYFRVTIPDCGMKAVFPAAAGDPRYGLQQASPRLVMFTDNDILAFITANPKPNAGNFEVSPYLDHYVDTNTLGGERCAGVTASPTWNFVLINATLMPRNARPAVYDIGINVRSHGKVVEQLRFSETFVLDQPVVIARYVPMKTTEMDDFEGIELVYAKKT